MGRKNDSSEEADVLKKPCHRHLTALIFGQPAFCQKAQTVKNTVTCIRINPCRFAGVLKHFCPFGYAIFRFISLSAPVFLFLVLFASQSYALDMEYYTYGGHDAVVNSFQKLALIFSDSGYKGLFFTVIVLGILFGGTAVFLKVLAGVRISPIAWVWPVLIGVVLYLGLIIPRGTLHIYDPVLNRYQAVGDIPDGIVALAGILNKIEQGLVDIVSTSGTVGYRDSAGGIGVQVLLGSVNSTLAFPDRYIDQSVKGYVKDCMFFELTRPGTGLSLNDVKSNNIDFLPLFQQAASPAIYTVWYDDTRRDGESVTCQEACNRINSYMTQPSNFDAMTNVVCASAGFNPSDANELNKCKTIIQDYVQYLDGVSVPPVNYIRQVYIAQRIEEAARTGDTSTVGNFYIGVSSKGIGLMANEWLPIMRAVVTAIAIGMIPFLVIFIPTPLVGKAIGIISGFFIWLTAWGVTDAIVHQFAIDQGYKVFEQVRQNRLGYDALIFMNDASVKTLSMFGIIRTSGIMLATVLTGMLIRFGGHALSMLAGNLAGTIQSQGTSAAMKTEDPAGSAGLVSQMREAGPTHAWANQFSYWQTLRSGALDKMSHTESNLQTTDALGGVVKDAAHARGTGSALSVATGAYAAKEKEKYFGNIGNASEIEGHAQAVTGIQSATRRSHVLPEQAASWGATDYTKDVTGYDVYENRVAQIQRDFNADRETAADMLQRSGINPVERLSAMKSYSQLLGGYFGTDMDAFNKWQGGGRVLTQDMVDMAGAKGVKGLVAGALVKGIGVDSDGNLTSVSMTVPVTKDNVNQVREFAEINGKSADSLREGMIMEATIDPKTGTGKITAETGLVTSDRSRASVDISSPVTVRTQAGEYTIEGGSYERQGNMVTLHGVNDKGQEFTFIGTSKDMKYEGDKIREISMDLSHARTDKGIYDRAVYSPEELREITSSLEKSGGPKEVIKELRRLSMSGKSADVERSMSVDERGGYIKVRSGGDAESRDFRLSQRGFEDVTKAIARVETGTSKMHYDVDKTEIFKGTEATIVTPSGVKSGYMAYDPDLKQAIFVAGNERYGIEKSIIRYQDEQRSGDGKVITPAGYVLENVTVDPRTKQVVTGKTTSIHIAEGQVNFGGKSFKATVFADTKTGKQLAVEGETGRYWTKTYNQDSWTVHRDMKVSGEVFSSVVTKHFGDEAGQYVSDFVTGIKEAGGVFRELGIKGGKTQGTTRTPAQLPKGHKATLYDAHGREIQ